MLPFEALVPAKKGRQEGPGAATPTVGKGVGVGRGKGRQQSPPRSSTAPHYNQQDGLITPEGPDQQPFAPTGTSVFRPESRPVGVDAKERAYQRLGLGTGGGSGIASAHPLIKRQIMMPSSQTAQGQVGISAVSMPSGGPDTAVKQLRSSPARGRAATGGGPTVFRSPSPLRQRPKPTTAIGTHHGGPTPVPPMMESMVGQLQMQVPGGESTLNLSAIQVSTASTGTAGEEKTILPPQGAGDILTVNDAIEDHGGLTVADLSPPEVVEVDRRRYDIDRDLPHNTHMTWLPPRAKLSLDEPILLASPGQHFTSEKGFIVHFVSPEEAGMMRAIEYIIFVENTQLFEVLPQIDPATGVISFLPANDITGLSVCWVRITDNAMIDPQTGEIASSEPLPFVVAVGVEKAVASAGLIAGGSRRPRDWKSHQTKVRAEYVSIVPTATAGDGQSSSVQGHTGMTQSLSPARDRKPVPEPVPVYSFPPTAPHQLRYEGLCYDLFTQFCAEKKKSTVAPGETLQLTDGRPSSEARTAAGSDSSSAPLLLRQDMKELDAASPAFHPLRQLSLPVLSVLSPLEQLKLVQLAQSSDTLQGERLESSTDKDEGEGGGFFLPGGGPSSGNGSTSTSSTTQLAKAEAELRQQIRREESRLGSDHVELIPLLVQHSRYLIQAGAQRLGDAIEALERVARIRMVSLGLTQHGGLDKETISLHPEVAPDGSLIDPLKKYEHYYTALTVLAAVLRYSGQYPEALEYLQYAQTVAEALGDEQRSSASTAINSPTEAVGTTSSAAATLGTTFYLRTLGHTAELKLLMGNYGAAAHLLERLVALCEVQYGTDAPQTNAGAHLLGVCYAEQGNMMKALEQHHRVLEFRRQHYVSSARAAQSDQQGRAHGHRQSEASTATTAERQRLDTAFLVADSLHYIAYTLLCPPTGAESRTEEQEEDGLQAANESLELFDQEIGVDSSVEATLLHTSLLLLVAAVYAGRGNTEATERLCDQAYDGACQARGEDSVEAALVLCEIATCQMTLGQIHVAQQQLESAQRTLLNRYGSQHPVVCRSWLLQAQCLLYNNRKQALLFANHASSALAKRLSKKHRDLGCAAEVLARVQLELDNATDALTNANEAYDTAVKTGYTARLPHLESVLCCAYGACQLPVPSSLVAHLEARVRNMKTAYGPTSQQLVIPLQNLAYAHFLLREFADAHHQLARALKIADSLNMVFLLGHLFKPSSQLAPSEVDERNRMSQDRLNPLTATTFSQILFAVGAVFESENKLEDAQLTYLQSQASLEMAGSQSSTATVEVLMALGRVLYQDGHYGDSLAYIEKAHNLLLEHHAKEGRLIKKAEEALRILHHRFMALGYQLVRHVDNRHKFAAYI